MNEILEEIFKHSNCIDSIEITVETTTVKIKPKQGNSIYGPTCSVTKENTNNPNILQEGYVVSYDPYVVKDKNNIDIEEIVNEVAKKISESVKFIKK